jgi:AbrB family looped-hinge helix DNA binding protein
MTITIDSAGRVVLPKAIRDRFHLVPGTEIDLNTDAEGINLRVRGTASTLVQRDGILVHTSGPSAPALDLDIATFINQQREGRSQDLVGN